FELLTMFRHVFVAIRVNQPSREPRPSKLPSCVNAFKKTSCAASSTTLLCRKNRLATLNTRGLYRLTISAKADSSPACACRARSRSKACSSPLASCGPHRCNGWRTLHKLESANSVGERLLFVVVAHLATTGFELRFRLFQLGFLLSSQDGKHFLMQIVL